VKLEPNESAFIIFRDKPENKKREENYPVKNNILTLTNSWNVVFNSVYAPEKNVIFNDLTDWSKSEDSFLKYFSGTATYTTRFDLSNIPEDQLCIDLGKVMVMAKVWLNDKYVGGVWTYPYRLNITDYINKGENILKIEVANNWMNRLIGDQQLPEDQRTTWTLVNPWRADSELQQSGLLGPVEIQSYKYQMVK